MSLSPLPAWFEASIFVILTCLASLACYAIARRLFGSKASAETTALANSVVFRIGALHSLILALVFAQEQLSYRDLNSTVRDESASVADIYYDLARYDERANAQLQENLVEYATLVVTVEWLELADGRLSSRAWVAWDKVYGGVLDLIPEHARHDALRSNMLEDLDTVRDSRVVRELAAQNTVRDMFWIAAISGLLIVVAAYFPFAPTLTNLLLLSAFAAYTGLVLFFIAAMGNPYSGSVKLEPVAFQRLVDDWSGNVADND